MATTLKLTREQLAIITGNDPRAIKAFEDFFATLNNLGSHAATHEPGGSDPLAVDALPTVGSLRTLGTGAAQACAGDDARLSDDRTPTAHAGTHVTGGGDTIADVVAAGNSGLMSGADKTKVDAIPASVAPLPQTAAGVGQANFIITAVGGSVTMGAGGMWYWELVAMGSGATNILYNPAVGGAGTFYGIAAGGTSPIGSSGANYWLYRMWRIT